MTGITWLICLAATAVVAILARQLCRKRTALPRQPAAPVRYTRHARERMTERGVTSTQVETVLAEPGRITRDLEENSVRLEKDHGDRVLKVWVAEPWPSSAETVVKSTAWQYRTIFAIASELVGRLIGAKGRTVQALREETGARINVNGPTVTITADDRAAMEYAIQRVTAIAPQRSQAAG